MWSIGGREWATPMLLDQDSDGTETTVSPRTNGRTLHLGDVKIDIVHDMLYPYSYLQREPALSSAIIGDGVTMVRAVPDQIHELDLGDSEIVVLGNAFELRRDPEAFVRTLMALRTHMGHGRLLYAPGIAEPANMALLSYAGVDMMDTSLMRMRAFSGEITLPEGTFALSADLGESDPYEASRAAAIREVNLIKDLIVKGRLRELVDMRATASPWSVAVLRLMDTIGYEFQERDISVVGGRIACNTPQAIQRPDVRRFRRRIREVYMPPEGKRVLLLLPCSARKPYSSSRTHRIFADALFGMRGSHMVHEVIVTSPLGTVPRELELVYPAAHYDIPVTGDWSCAEVAMVRSMVEHIVSFGYDTVISHLGHEGTFVNDAIDCIDTSHGRPTSGDALRRLRSTLEGALADLKSSGIDYNVAQMTARARFQFGPGAEALLEDARIRGKYPFLKIQGDEGQRGMLTPDRGLISLTLEGGRRLIPEGRWIVEMEDFKLGGSLFAVGVEHADDRIRVGDEALITRKGELKAVGVAQMRGSEMMDSRRGVAVKVRHRSK